MSCGCRQQVRLAVRCIAPKCRRRPPFEADVPTWLVGAMVVAYHACHEGHELELEVDGVVYRPGVQSGGQ